MPYKRKRKHNAISGNEKKFIISRLMEISLRVDDYIYNDNPIPKTEAELYLQAVTSFKAQCYNDERSLQVIEKLIKIMRTIISEHQEITNNICYTNVQNSHSVGTISPVYSIADEDRLELSQVAHNKNISIDNAMMENEIIDLCDENDDISLESGKKDNVYSFTVNVEVQEEMSSLSLNPNDNAIHVAAERVECSQSILNDIENIHSNNDNATIESSKIDTSDEKKTVASCYTENIVISNEPIHNSDTSINKIKEIAFVPFNRIRTNKQQTPINHIVSGNTITNDNNNKKSNASNNKSLIINSISKNLTAAFGHSNGGSAGNINRSYNEQSRPDNIAIHNTVMTYNKAQESNETMDIPDINESTKYVKNPETRPKDMEILKDYNEIQSLPEITKAKSTTDIKKSHKAPTANVTNIPNMKDIKPKTNKSRKKKAQTIEDNKCKPNNVRKRSNTRKKQKINDVTKTTAIYNDNTENDLSWVENIRFVREINADEYERQLTRDNFWDNYSLPDVWDEQYFYYSN